MKINTFLVLAISTVLLCFFSLDSAAQAPNWVWAKSAVGTGDDQAYSVAVDGSGNVFVAGSFRSATLTFGLTTLTNNGSLDFFVAKYDAYGNVLWAKSAGGTDTDLAISIAVDVTGNVYVAGEFYSSLLTIGSTTLANTGASDIFLAKYDSNGNVLWSKSAVGSQNERISSVAVDATGAAYLTGYFTSPILNVGTNALILTGWIDVFLVKYDANGDEVWAKSFGGSGTDYYEATSVAVDVSGNLFVAGRFRSDNNRFLNIILTNSSDYNIFLTKFDDMGIMLWAKCVGGMLSDEANSIALDATGNVFMTGCFESANLVFDHTTLTNNGWTDLFVAKFDPNGTELWAKNAVGTRNDKVNSISVDASGNAYITGCFGPATLTFGSITLTNTGTNDIFLSKYDANGNVIWAKSAVGTEGMFANSVAVDASENIFVTGWFGGPAVSFGSTTLTISSPKSYDIFLSKSANGTGKPELDYFTDLSIYPNPANDLLTIEGPQKSAIEILNMHGQTLLAVDNHELLTTIDLSKLVSGIYLIKAKTDKGVTFYKFIKN